MSCGTVIWSPLKGMCMCVCMCVCMYVHFHVDFSCSLNQSVFRFWMVVSWRPSCILALACQAILTVPAKQDYSVVCSNCYPHQVTL